MNKSIISLLFCFFYIFCFAQKKNVYYYDDLKLFKKSKQDSIHIKKTLDSLVFNGYFTLQKDSIKLKNNEFFIYIKKGTLFENQIVKLDSLSEKALNTKNIIPSEIDSSLQKIKKYYLNKGFPFVMIHSKSAGNKINIKTKLNEKRTIDELIFQEKLNIAKTYKKHINNKFLTLDYSPINLLKLQELLQNNEFLKLIKNPQVLFTQDSTKIFINLENKKNSNFEGILGMNSDSEGKPKFTGNVKLELKNLFSSFERININWQSNPEDLSQLNMLVNVPFLYKKYLGSESKISIIRQDSTYVKIKFNQNLFNQIYENQIIGLSFSFENSNYVKEEIDLNYQDYSKTGIGILYQLKKLRNSRLVPFNHRILFEFNSLTNRLETSTKKQYEIKLFTDKLFLLKNNHYLYSKANFYTLLSDDYIQNEMQSIGGFNSIRGFNDDSFFVNSYAIGTLEYRYLKDDSFYFNTFSDFSWLENKIQKQNSFVYSFGFGIGFINSIGLININYALGKNNVSKFDFSQSKIHIGITTFF